MNPIIRSLSTSSRRIAAACTALCLATLSSVALGQLVDISNSPLYGGRQAHPNVVVTTSVEFPTVGSAYLRVNGQDNPYVRTNTYLGYFDPSKCYQYKKNNGGYFYTSKNALADANHECGNAYFSGNFMNYSTMSAIDEFRYAMTGGNRDDETGPNNGTIVQRATLPDGSGGTPSFYNTTAYFPNRQVSGNNAVLPSNIGNGKDTININNCYERVYFGSRSDGSCQNPNADFGNGQGGRNGPDDGGYYVRVNVCDDDEGPVRTDLCLQYGGSKGLYKPVGVVQANANRMRFAVFGYLLDYNTPGGYAPGCNNGGWNKCRYGGVLRAPMKYLGTTKYDANLTASDNLKNAEILADGTLAVDPDKTALGTGLNSGFINYINKFGSRGVYKTYDPMGEMYYEAIRYYQNLGPTPDATSTFTGAPLTDAVKDYFPITTTWTDPILATCSANYIINLSDSNTWDDSYMPGYAGSPGAVSRPASRPVTAGLDTVLWTQRIGDLEANTTSLTTNDVRPGLDGIETRRTQAEATYLAAGAAYWANVNDIRSDLPGTQTIKTLSFDVDEYGSITRQDRQLYLMGKYGGFTNSIDRSTDTFQNPFFGTNPAAPTGPAIRTNSEWESSAGSGVPANYVVASDPLALIAGVRNAFARIASQTGTLSGAALTSANLTYGAAGAYIATFDPTKWSGSVLFSTLTVDANGNLVVSSTPNWKSADLLDARCGTVSDKSTTCTDLDASASKRNIFTTVQSGLINPVRKAVSFTYANILANDANYLAALNTNPTTNLPDALGQARLNYLRGYRADESTLLSFRPRASAMGDIVNSGPVYVGPPTSSIPDSDYQAFYKTYAITSPRSPAVYVGANDGMMHALRAIDGVELFSYIPGFSYKDLNDLTNPGYQHQIYVDTVPKVQEAKVGTNWKTVLLGANGAGAQGVFALDVTAPDSFGPSNVMFEFSDADDADFGSVMAAPEFAKLWVSGPATAPVYRYFAVVTGYNNKRTTVNYRTDTQVSTDTLNKGVLFLIALDHTLGTAWQKDVDYYKFTFPASDPAKPNGLAPVTLSASKSGDLTTASMYFGDLQGNLWKFNTTSGDPSTWGPALGTKAVPIPIFVAQDSSNNRQPITARVELANGPFGSTLIYFGTGEYLGLTDLSLPGTVQSEYSLLDVNPSVAISRSTNLVGRTAATGTCPTGVTGPCLNVTGASFSYSGALAKKGWYLDFPFSSTLGERSITKPAIRTGLLTFTTLTLSNDLCTPGNGYIYQVNALTGLALPSTGTTIGYSSTVGIPGPPRVVDLTVTSGQTQATGEVINLKTQTTLVSGTAGKIGSFGSQTAIKVPPTQQVNWREITNWNDRVGK